MKRPALLITLLLSALGCAVPEAPVAAPDPKLSDDQKMAGLNRVAQVLSPAIHEAAMRGLTKVSPAETTAEIVVPFKITTVASGGQVIAAGENVINWSTAGFTNLVVEAITWREVDFELGDGLPILTHGEGAIEGALTGTAEDFTGDLVFKGNVEINTESFPFEITFTYAAKTLTFAGMIDQLPVSGVHHFVWLQIMPPLAFIHIGSCQPMYIQYVCVDYYSPDFTPADQQAACEAKDQYYSADTLCPADDLLGTCTVVTSGLGSTQIAKERIYNSSGFGDQGGKDVCDLLHGTWELE